MSPQLKSPFKFLDPYGPQDSEIFFGRKDEEDLLYQYINKNRLVLVYGTSGTGKTSLVQCGLSKRLEVTDWVPFYIRRGNNINESVTRAIHGCKAMQDSDIVADGNGALITALQQVNVYYLRPVYLIFDQFEELLIMGDEDEKQAFIKLVHTIFTSPQTKFCSLLFILREEYFAWMEPFEKLIPGFSDRRLRVENMRPQQVKDVILRSCEAFHITLEDGAKNVDQIIDTVANKTNIPLPYLQVYLDQLWREDYKRTYPEGYPGKEDPPPLVITTKEIEACGKIKDVLQRFLVERKDAIQKELKEKFPHLPDNFTAKVLDSFVSFKGTKRPLAYQVDNDYIVLSATTAPELADLPANALHNCLTELERSRIVRMDGSYIELAHDVLAALIDDMRSDMERRLNEIRYQIHNRREEYRYTGDVLSIKELNYYDEYLDKLHLNDELMNFYRFSQQKRQEEEDNTRGLKKQLHRRKLLGYLGLALIPVVFLLFITIQKISRDANRNLGLLFLASKLKNTSKLNGLNMIPIIKEKLYGEDSAAVSATLLEYMQSQDIQSLFSVYSDTLSSTSLAEAEINMSPDGNYLIYLDKKDTSWVVRDATGAEQRRFKDVEYVYFTNRAAIAVIAKKYTPPAVATNSVLQNNYAGLPRDVLIYDCNTGKTLAYIQLKYQQYMYPFRFVYRRFEREYDSYRIRYLSNNNLLLPYCEIDRNGIQKGKVRLMRDTMVLQELPSELSISTAKDNSRFMTGALYSSPTFDANVYNANGQRTGIINGAYFADFSNDDGLFYTTKDFLYAVKGTDTFRTVAFDPRYAYADIDKDFLLMETNSTGTPDTLQIKHIRTAGTFTYPEKLIGINYEQQVVITQWKQKALNPDQQPPSTLYRRPFQRGAVLSYTVADGITRAVYNSAADEIMVLTATNRLLLLRSNMSVKTAFQLTTNDVFGLSKNGKRFFYVRDQYLTVFKNDSALVNVFDPVQSEKLLAGPSPIYHPLPEDSLRNMGLIFK